MTSKHELMQLERSIAENKRLIELSKTLKRLESNSDYQAIIGQLYMKDEAVRLVHLKADAAMQSEVKQVAIVKDIDAIGSLAGFLRCIHIQADIADRTLSNDEDTYAELSMGGE
jgi:hypothetical protein